VKYHIVESVSGSGAFTMFARWSVCLLVVAVNLANGNKTQAVDDIYDDDSEISSLFTLEQLRQGAVLLYIFGIVYMICGIVIASEEFFVPSLAVMMDQLKITEDVAGVTLMTLGIALPGLILSIIGVFISVPSANIGGIVGPSLHNILLVIGFCALFTSQAAVIPCWVLLRDWTSFLFFLIIFILFSVDQAWAIWECLILVFFYIAYIVCVLIMVKVKPKLEALICQKSSEGDIQLEDQPKAPNQIEDEPQPSGLPLSLSQPSGSCPNMVLHIIFFPIIFLLYISLPDPRNPKSRKLSILSFIGSVVWIHAFQHLMIWWLSTAGNVLGMPAEMTGLIIPSLLLITGLVAARSGYTIMAVSAVMGVNIFDTLLGGPLPWFVYSVVFDDTMQINTSGLTCSLILLLFFWLLALITLLAARRRMKRLVGGFLVIFYVLFVFVSLVFVYGYVQCPV